MLRAGEIEGSGGGGIIGGAMNWFSDSIKQGIIDCVKWLANCIFDVLAPFIEWGCKIIIVWCIVTVFCTKDTKSLSLAFKTFLIYLIFGMLRGVFV